MLQNFAKKIFGSANDRYIRRLRGVVAEIGQLESGLKPLSDEQLTNKTVEFKERLQKGETTDQLLPEAFAVVREAALRVLKMRHFDVQLIGGIALHQGKVAEMKTGEGKTLVATLPVYLNALTGRGVHVVTVNDYLAKRDSDWMGQLYRFLGLSVGCIVHGLRDDQRRENYGSDITYGTNNEFGFDYLRDNMKFRLEDYVQRELHYCIVDEVDSILIDEARTPLIISGPTEESTDKYYTINAVIPRLQKEADFTIEEKSRTAALTEEGVSKVEQSLRVDNLYAPENIELVHHVHQALKAHAIFKRDVDYVVKDGQVIIVDEFTGRLMPGRRYSDGLHQALEAKENVTIENENQTLATITFQNYFRMYDKLSGMTGTADTEAAEFQKIYNLDVVVVPTNKPMIRDDRPDMVYKNEAAKIRAIVNDVKELNADAQPVLIGTVSIEKSERLSEALKRAGVKHNVLNAKNHEKEAEIVALAGHKGSVTIATAMAGRGTDIVLGEGVREMGGLHIIGNERHESRRIDNQFRGRSGRQGDPGSSRFYLSLEDDLLRIFQGEKIKAYMERFNMEEDVPIESKLISRAIENAQKKVEAHNFDIRKHLLEYDDVLNKQREVVYELRKLILSGRNSKPLVLDIIREQIDGLVSAFASVKLKSEWDTKGLSESLLFLFDNTLGLDQSLIEKVEGPEDLAKILYERAEAVYDRREKDMTPEVMRQLEEWVYLGTIDQLWKDHLLNMDHLKEGVGLRGYGQKDPLVEYKKEGFELFKLMDEQVKTDVITKVFRVQVNRQEQVEDLQPKEQEMHFSRGDDQGAKGEPSRRDDKKVGRNDPCPCGSGKKFKKCHGR
ncbi:MAG: preprotein translocase subunit SecA [Bdellovibrionaceae bacterium]|nr:preprotein translocase subunit SecA [Bdellovibrionales bacterium]MCB9255000.1 preprotein translocase subunit SecA [Pseudobdellovibrionaceae bacterium]